MRKRNTTGEYAISSVEACAASRTDALPMDSDAFAGFYQRSAPPLRGYLMRVSGNSALADDLLQESYLRFLCATPPEGGEVGYRRYLFRIATNLLHDHWRKPKTSSVDDVPESFLISHDILDRVESQATLDPAMAAGAATALARARRGIFASRDRRDHRLARGQHPSIAVSRAAQNRPPAAQANERPTEASMTFRLCSYEKELIQELKAGHWPDGCDRELRTHVETCSSCRDLVLVTQAFQRARNESVQEAPSGHPGLLWWRAQLRSRNDAATKLSKPMTFAQIFAWLVTAMCAVALVTSRYWRGLHWASLWSSFRASLGAWLAPSQVVHDISSAAARLNWNLLLLLPGLGVLVLLSGVIVYLTSDKQ